MIDDSQHPSAAIAEALQSIAHSLERIADKHTAPSSDYPKPPPLFPRRAAVPD